MPRPKTNETRPNHDDKTTIGAELGASSTELHKVRPKLIKFDRTSQQRAGSAQSSARRPELAQVSTETDVLRDFITLNLPYLLGDINTCFENVFRGIIQTFIQTLEP